MLLGNDFFLLTFFVSKCQFNLTNGTYLKHLLIFRDMTQNVFSQ